MIYKSCPPPPPHAGMKAGRGIWATLVPLGLELGQYPGMKQGQFIRDSRGPPEA